MLLDTYAWIEFFLGSPEGDRVKEVVESGEAYTCIVSLAEIVVWCLKNKKDSDERIGIIKNSSEILDLSEKIVCIGGRINFEVRKSVKDFGMIDSLIYATAQIYGLKLLTGDRHFEGLESVEMLRKIMKQQYHKPCAINHEVTHVFFFIH